MSNIQENEAYLILIDRHICQVQASLDRLKQELNAASDSAALIEKVDALRGMVNEMNLMAQYRNEILDNLESEIFDPKHSNAL